MSTELKKKQLSWFLQLVKPFDRANTAAWRERAEWLSAIEAIRETATEAELHLSKTPEGERNLNDGATALAELEIAFEKLSSLRNLKRTPTP